jgi:hypothetical protein
MSIGTVVIPSRWLVNLAGHSCNLALVSGIPRKAALTRIK